MKSKLLLLVFLCSMQTLVHAQHNWEHKPSPYFSAHVGTFPIENQFLANINLSGGYQFSQWLGLGLSNGHSAMLQTEGPSVSGLALQYRALPGGKVILSADAGLIYRFSKSCDSTCEYRYLPEANLYFAFNAYFRLTKVFTLGIGGVALPSAQTEEWYYDDVDGGGEPMWYFRQQIDHRYEVGGFIVTLGVSVN